MWIIDFLPDWIWTLVLWLGIISIGASYLLAKIPVVSQYKLPLRIGGVVALLIGVYFQGAVSNEEKWQARVKELEAKIAVAEEKSKEETVKIVNKTVVKREYYRERGNDIVQYVDREIVKYDNTCPVPKEVVKAHNDAAVAGDKK
jgi:hypothetical protein